MVRRFYDLPSLNALAVFEATARHASVTRASQELNVTPGAVSRQIKRIEKELEVELFLRNGQGVELTAAGQDLYHVLARSFLQMAEVVHSVRQNDIARNVALACSDTFTTMWLLPRMPRFWAAHPEITVDHVIWENTSNIRRSDVELRVRFGSGSWAGEDAEFLFDDCVYPVCGPQFAERHAGHDLSALNELPLLNVDWVRTDWVGWDEALLRLGVHTGAVRGRRFGKFGVALQAAVAEQGLVIGWHRMVRPMLERGELVRFGTRAMPIMGGYYLTTPTGRKLSRAAIQMRDWILDRSREERAQPLPPC